MVYQGNSSQTRNSTSYLIFTSQPIKRKDSNGYINIKFCWILVDHDLRVLLYWKWHEMLMVEKWFFFQCKNIDIAIRVNYWKQVISSVWVFSFDSLSRENTHPDDGRLFRVAYVWIQLPRDLTKIKQK